MRYFIDTEFIEYGPHKPVDLISVGIVAADGREYYAVSSEFDSGHANDWVIMNVLPYVGDVERKSLSQIASEVFAFISFDVTKPEFWGYYADYDWVVFCQMFGTMMDLPKGWPMYCRDIKQYADEVGNPKLPEQDSTEHNALNDARWNMKAWQFLESRPCPHTWNDGNKAWGCVLPANHRGPHSEYALIPTGGQRQA